MKNINSLTKNTSFKGKITVFLFSFLILLSPMNVFAADIPEEDYSEWSTIQTNYPNEQQKVQYGYEVPVSWSASTASLPAENIYYKKTSTTEKAHDQSGRLSFNPNNTSSKLLWSKSGTTFYLQRVEIDIDACSSSWTNYVSPRIVVRVTYPNGYTYQTSTVSGSGDNHVSGDGNLYETFNSDVTSISITYEKTSAISSKQSILFSNNFKVYIGNNAYQLANFGNPQGWRDNVPYTSLNVTNTSNPDNFIFPVTRAMYRHPLYYAINFNTNNGQISPTDITPSKYSPNEITTIPVPTRYGYDFDGWYTNPEFSGTKYTDSIPAGTMGNLDLYAKWEEKSDFLIFDANGGDLRTPITGIKASNKLTYTEKFIIPPFTSSSESPYKMGYVFKGWSYSATSSSPDFLPGAIFKDANIIPDIPEEKSTLYAVWKLGTYSISYDTTCKPYNVNNPTTYTIKDNKTLFKISDHDGWTFDGYYLDPTFTSSELLSIQPNTLEGDQTLYCKWKDLDSPILSSLSYSPDRYKPSGDINYTNKDVKVTFNYSDLASGVNKVYVVKKIGTNYSVVQDLSSSIASGSKNGTVEYTATQRWQEDAGYYFMVIDVAGNKAISESLAPLHIDKQEPIFVEISNSQEHTSVDNNNLTATATDDWSGVAYWEYNATYTNSFGNKVDTGWMKVYPSTDPMRVTGTIGIPASSYMTTKLRACDNAGNCSIEQDGPSTNFEQSYNSDSQLADYNYIFALWDKAYPGQTPDETNSYAFISSLEQRSASNLTVKSFIDYISAAYKVNGNSYSKALQSFFKKFNYNQRNGY